MALVWGGSCHLKAVSKQCYVRGAQQSYVILQRCGFQLVYLGIPLQLQCMHLLVMNSEREGHACENVTVLEWDGPWKFQKYSAPWEYIVHMCSTTSYNCRSCKQSKLSHGTGTFNYSYLDHGWYLTFVRLFHLSGIPANLDGICPR